MGSNGKTNNIVKGKYEMGNEYQIKSNLANIGKQTYQTTNQQYGKIFKKWIDMFVFKLFIK